MVLDDWTTYVFAGVVVAVGLGGVYYLEHVETVRFEQTKDAQFNEPEIVQGNWRFGRVDGSSLEANTFVVFKRPGDQQQHLARVVATEGQKVQVTVDSVLVDGQKFTVAGIKNQASMAECPEMIVPRRCVYVICDDRWKYGSVEHDSRAHGPIPVESVTHSFKAGGRKD